MKQADSIEFLDGVDSNESRDSPSLAVESTRKICGVAKGELSSS